MNEMKKQRVLHILSSLKSGGAETNLLALIAHFNYGIFEHAVAYGGGGELEKEFNEKGVKLIKLSNKPLSIFGLLRLRGAIKQLEDYQPNLIHTHLDIPNLYGLITSYYTGAKIVMHFHGFGIFYREVQGLSLLNRVIWWALTKCYRYCDCAVAICDYQLPYLKRAGIINQKIRKIKNGITLDQNAMSLAAFDNIPDNAYIFVNVARLHKQKNHKLLITAFKEVVKETKNAHLILAGDGPQYSEIKQMIDNYGLEDNVSMLGMRRDIPAILASCNCFVQASSWELSPITILEAMLAKMPIIATDVGGISELVTSYESGVLIEDGDTAGLTVAMTNMASQKELAIQMGVKGYERVVNEYSNSKIVKQIENVYMELLCLKQI